jgi:iron complex outermembrane recepter protein
MRQGLKKYRIGVLVVLAAALTSMPAITLAAEEELGTMVVTAPPMKDPFTVETDPKAPRQPLPASDGATLLKNIPGFSVTRKGGTDGDPVFRGLGGSRLNILQDGNYIFGGCGGRMDPPTAYIYPEIFDIVRVIKGPQTVLYGGGNIAGTVLFERDTPAFAQPGLRFFGTLLGGSFGRNDQVLDTAAGGEAGFVRLAATRSRMGDYEDGGGRKVHSEYTRWNTSGILGWTPGTDTRLEVNFERGDGEAAYADRGMDGSKFDRTGYGARFEARDLSRWLERLELKLYHNYVDHVMDNFSLRANSGMKRINNPDRTTRGGRAEVQVSPTQATFLTAGLDYQENDHTVRSASSMTVPSVADQPRLTDAEFRSAGLFGELDHQLDGRNRLTGGLRLERDKAVARKAPDAFGGVAAGTSDRNTNQGAFLRYERELTARPLTLHAGLGRAERSPDYWERAKLFFLATEKSTQLDLGLSYRTPAVNATMALFHAKVDDYILISSSAPTAQNVDATLSGGEADISYSLAANWRLNSTLAYTRGKNDTRGTPLPQVPPLEGILALSYDDRVWSAGVALRAVARQNRVDVGYGNIVGQDIGETAGFATLSLNGGYRAPRGILITAGVDNLLDKEYAEHISRAGAAVSGFEQTTRVNEPGRFLWLKLSFEL